MNVVGILMIIMMMTFVFFLKVDEAAIVGPAAKRKSASEDADNVISREIKRVSILKYFFL